MDIPPEEPTNLPTPRRVRLLNRDDRLYHVILAQQFDRDMIDHLCRIAEMTRIIGDARAGARFLNGILSHKRAMLYFIQPSTRTFLSFAAACQILGMPYNDVRDPSTSSEVKGETEEDTVRVLSQYFDVIIMRHPSEGFAETMANKLNGMRRSIPLLNGAFAAWLLVSSAVEVRAVAEALIQNVSLHLRPGCNVDSNRI